MNSTAFSTSFFSRNGQLGSMEQTVVHAEKHLGQLCSLLGSYSRKTAKLRDTGDHLAGQITQLSNSEDPEASLALKVLAQDLSTVQDYRHAQVERLDANVVAPLKAYRDIVKNKRAELKKFSSDRNKEMKELQRLEKIRRQNPADRQSIAEVSLQKASSNAQRSTRQMEETITEFQRNKLEDIKRIFQEFITVEMIFHCKALEVYGLMFQNLEGLDVDKDLEMFSRRIRMQVDPLLTASRPGDPLLTSSHSLSSVDRLHTSPTAPVSTRHRSPRASLRSTLASTATRGRHIQLPAEGSSFRSGRNSTLQRQREVDEEEEEEEEEEEDEDEEMLESEPEEVQKHPARHVYSGQYVRRGRLHK